jgi:hypothetical protein
VTPEPDNAEVAVANFVMAASRAEYIADMASLHYGVDTLRRMRGDAALLVRHLDMLIEMRVSGVKGQPRQPGDNWRLAE